MPISAPKLIVAKARRFVRKPCAEQFLHIRVLFLMLCMRIALSIYSLKRILQALRKHSRPKAHLPALPIATLCTTLKTVGRHCPGATCLVISLTGYYFLTRNGHKPELHIGIKKENNDQLAAHAWLTIDNDVILGKIEDLSTYTPFPTENFSL